MNKNLNELLKLTEKELELIIGVCQFIINTLEICLSAKHLEEEEE